MKKQTKADRARKPVANKPRVASPKAKAKPVARTAPPAAPAPKRPPRKRVAAAPAPAPAAAAPAALEIPAFLLEGDEPSLSTVSGPGQRYALGPTAPVGAPALQDELGELPTAYGTKRILLTARDPHWLYAYWDLTAEQLREYNALSVDRHLVLRVYVKEARGEPHTEVHVHPESRNWFVHVDRAATKYVAALGYYTFWHEWETLSVSPPTVTPPDTLSSDTTVRFATIPVEVPFEQLVAVIKAAVSEHIPLAEALAQLRAEGHVALPQVADLATPGEWTPAQERALAELVSMDSVRRVWIGSLEITELVRRHLERGISSAAASQFGLPPGAVSSVSSPFGGGEQRRGFWFNVNAELIVYGATEPNATVTIGGRPIKLRPDGTFGYRFALPDGDYALPAAATSADGQDRRHADLHFGRRTAYRGDVGQHPQDPQLKPPAPEHVS
jgi:hypothetical protein